MTDTEAIAQVNAMKAETLTVKAEVSGAYSDVAEALEALQNSVDNVSAALSATDARVKYLTNYMGG